MPTRWRGEKHSRSRAKQLDPNRKRGAANRAARQSKPRNRVAVVQGKCVCFFHTGRGGARGSVIRIMTPVVAPKKWPLRRKKARGPRFTPYGGSERSSASGRLAVEGSPSGVRDRWARLPLVTVH